MKDRSIKNILVPNMFLCATSYQILIDFPTVSRTVVYADFYFIPVRKKFDV
jgi:hypothetical protein